MDEAQRKALVESGPVYLADGLRAGFAGYKSADYCGVHSARPGFWACSWDTAAEVAARSDRRFLFGRCGTCDIPLARAGVVALKYAMRNRHASRHMTTRFPSR